MSKSTHLLLLIGCTLTLSLCSCRGQKGGRSVEEIAREIVVAPLDTTVYARLVNIKGDSLIVEPEYDENTRSYAYLQAMGEGQVVGDLCPGDKYALNIEGSSHRIVHMLNLSQMAGQWFYNMEEQRGITFTVAGALSSINASDFTFRKWKVLNGSLLLYYYTIKEDGTLSEEMSIDTTMVKTLTNNKMEFDFRGKLFTCQRQTKPIKIKLNF